MKILRYIKSDWINNPTKNQAIFLSVLYLIIISVCLIYGTAGLGENSFRFKILFYFFALIFSSVKLYTIWKNYFANKKDNVSRSSYLN